MDAVLDVYFQNGKTWAKQHNGHNVGETVMSKDDDNNPLLAATIAALRALSYEYDVFCEPANEMPETFTLSGEIVIIDAEKWVANFCAVTSFYRGKHNGSNGELPAHISEASEKVANRCINCHDAVLTFGL